LVTSSKARTRHQGKIKAASNQEAARSSPGFLRIALNHPSNNPTCMKLKPSDLWRWDGEVTRGTFVLWAIILFLVKFNLDRLLLRTVFHRDWSPFAYSLQPFPRIEGLSPAHTPGEFAFLLAAALPFLWMGVVLCLKRLRNARLPLWLAVLFVVPILKWFLFDHIIQTIHLRVLRHVKALSEAGAKS
jgi:uncharacterized membrane protein YhaH (DUF805 family)